MKEFRSDLYHQAIRKFHAEMEQRELAEIEAERREAAEKQLIKIPTWVLLLINFNILLAVVFFLAPDAYRKESQNNHDLIKKHQKEIATLIQKEKD